MIKMILWVLFIFTGILFVQGITYSLNTTVAKLITHRYAFNEIKRAFEAVGGTSRWFNESRPCQLLMSTRLKARFARRVILFLTIGRWISGTLGFL